MSLTLSCTSGLSQSGQSKVSSTLSVQYLDVCRTAQLTLAPIAPVTMTTYLWPVPIDSFSFQSVSSSLNCAPYDYSILLGSNTDPSVASGVLINTRSLQPSIQTVMTKLSQVGNWNLQVKACILFGFGDSMCVLSNTVTLQVRNPCIITNINSSAIDRALVGSVGAPDSYQVQQWMFSDSVDMARNPSSYGSRKCGVVSAIVKNMQGQTVDFVALNESSGLLTLNPSANSAVGTFQLVMHYYMKDYPDRWINVDFMVTVQPCKTTIYSNGADLTNRQIGWAENPI